MKETQLSISSEFKSGFQEAIYQCSQKAEEVSRTTLANVEDCKTQFEIMAAEGERKLQEKVSMLEKTVREV